MRFVLFGGAPETSIHPIVLAGLILVGLWILFLPRRQVLQPFAAMSLIVPLGQVVMLGPAHFSVSRILLIFVWLRILMLKFGRDGREFKLRLNIVDGAVVLYALSRVVNYTVLWQQLGALNNELGTAYTTLGVYFGCRFFVRDQEDIDRAVKTLAGIAAFIAFFMLNEQLTGFNALAIFGGLPLHTAMRNGYLRSQGPFEVYLTAGAFGATLVPLFFNLFRRGGSRLFGLIGLAAAVVIIITSRTSTAISAGMAAMAGVGCWYIRDRMRLFRWSALAGLIALNAVMKAPVWWLVARIDLVGGNSGWHRAMIIENCVRHFSEWFLVGARYYGYWEGGDDMWDLANQYVAIAESTGLLPLLAFLAALVYCFKRIGVARKAAVGTPREWYLWLLGVALFTHLVGFFGISYFDQISIYWYLFLAIIVAATDPRFAPGEPAERAERPPSDFDWYRPALEEASIPAHL